MTQAPQRIPAIEGWFADDPEPHLIGSRCQTCGTFSFPKVDRYCRNPTCDGEAFEQAPLSRTGRLWSYTNNQFKPPAPYVSPEPFEPYTIAAVELSAEQMVVLGQVTNGVDHTTLRVGMEMELVIDPLYVDEAGEHTVWKWRPISAAPTAVPMPGGNASGR